MTVPATPPPWADPAVIATRRPVALRRDWETDSLCRTIPARHITKLFFPRRGTGVTQDQAYRATVDQYCARCPVNTDCTAAHVTEREGVFGSTPAQRKALRRRLAGLGVVLESPRVDPRSGIPRADATVRQANSRARA